MLRIVLFLATNIAVLAVLGLSVTGLGALGVLPPELLAARGPLLILAGVIGVGGSLISLLLSKRVALWSTGAEIIEIPRSQAEAWLLETVARLASRAGISTPDVAIYDAPEPNAFATGWNRDDGLVAVSTGLLRRLSDDEIAAVLAHEVSHVANGDMVTLALIQGVLNTFVVLASRLVGGVIDRAVFRSERGYGPAFWITTIMAEMLLGVLATMLVMAFSRWREFRADAGAKALVGARPMVDALQQLKRARGAGLPDGLQAFGISGGAALTRLFASHPPLDARIERLLRSDRRA